MPQSAPELQRLLDASTLSERNRAWKLFLDAFSPLLVHVARSVFREHDEAMDAYAYALQELRADDFGRLRAFSAQGASKFSTWFVVVTQRLCLDYRRKQYGRVRAVQSLSARVTQDLRRRLRDLAGEDIDLGALAESTADPAEQLAAREVRHLLALAVGTLSTTDRLLLTLRFDDGLSASQIARVMHLPTAFHVYRRLDAAIRTLRADLVARGVESAAP
ncbi:MAG TPA: sigma-70 family RNA polymerase sigma factor [Gemmatimonadaceae bacterium]